MFRGRTLNARRRGNIMNRLFGGRSTRARIVRRVLRDVLFLALSQAVVPIAYSQGAPAALALKPVDMKLLVLAGSGTEPSFLAIQSFLNGIGIPHNDVILAPTGRPAVPLPPLTDGSAATSKGLYQGIILATGSLAVCNAAGTCGSALTDAEWTALDTYAATYGVRTLSYYTFPSARYGMSFVSALATTAATPGAITFGPPAGVVFSYLNTARALPVTNSYVYLAAPAVVMGESTSPLLSMGGATVAVIHRKPDGREYLALTFDNNPNLVHSLALSYGLVNWVTKGVFLGARKIYLTPQVDDLFLANDLFDTVTPGCKPTGFLVDPTVDLGSACQNDQMAAQDVNNIVAWQDRIQTKLVTRGFQVTMAFNGVGAADETGVVDTSDELVSAVMAKSNKFIWVSHTLNHINLDCYDAVPNSHVCRPATAAESVIEIDNNAQIGVKLGLNADTRSMVTPEISGLNNPEFLHTAAQRGIKYLIVDSSTLVTNPPPHNTGIRNSLEPSILMVPRRPTSIFYNTTSAYPGDAGSLPDEYNYFYGPAGLFRIGGPGGAPFYTVNQTYAQIIDHESDSLLIDMLRFKADPSMYHQSNLINYDGVNSLFTDVMGQTMKKYNDLMNLPILSLPQSAIGDLYQERMDYNASGVQATWYPGTPPSIKLTAAHAASIPLTGFCSAGSAGCEIYGGQGIKKVPVTPGQTVTVNP